MPEEKETRLVIEWKRLFPWWHIFRAFSIALDMRKLGLAIIGIVATWLGWALFAWWFDPGEPKEVADSASYHQQVYLHEITREWKIWPAHVQRGDPQLPPHRAVAELSPRLASLDYWMRQVPAVLEPLERLIRPLTYFLHPNVSWKSHIFAALGILWTLVVWGFVGGALTRIAAVEFARRDRISIGEAVRFTASHFVSLFAAPIFPIAVVALITVAVVVVGTVLIMVPWVGDLVGAFTFPLALLAGLLMAVVLLVYAGWPLLYPAITAEAGDALDAISRTMSYMYQRPWHYVFYWAVALVYGVIVLFFAVTFTSFFVYMTSWGLDLAWRPPWRTGDIDPVRALFIYAPESYGWRSMLTGDIGTTEDVAAKMAFVPWVAAVILGFWLHLVFLGMLGFAYSLFWSVSTIIYFLLRKAVDETDLDEVYLEEEQDELFPRPIAAPDVSVTTSQPPDVSVTSATPGGQPSQQPSEPSPPGEQGSPTAS